MPWLQTLRSRLTGLRGTALVAILTAGLVAPAGVAQDAAPLPTPEPLEAPPLSAEQIEALVAPIALYPDPLLAQCLVAFQAPT